MKMSRMNGFSVSGLLLNMLCFVGGFYPYIARSAGLSQPIHLWFQVLFPSGPVLMLLGLAFCVLGIIGSRGNQDRNGKVLGIIGLIVGVLAVLHYAALVVLDRLMSGYA